MPRARFLWNMVFDGEGRPAEPASRPSPLTWRDEDITGSCLGHSTVLLNFLGVRVLIDPVFSRRVGPGVGRLVLGPKRRLQPALRPRDIGTPDVILLSHAHFDHLDAPSLRRFSRDTTVVTAAGTGDLLRRFRNVHELAWGQATTLSVRGKTVRITAIPVAHWGARMIKDTHRGYCGYLLEQHGRAICYAGDTAYTTSFAALRQTSPHLDLAIVPIGAYDPWIRAHCSPEQAVTMAEQAGAAYFVPVHHQTFRLSHEPMTEPARRVRAAFRDAPHRLLATEVGETFRVPHRDERLAG